MTTIAEFSISYIHFLNEHGELLQDLPSTVTHDMLLEFYEKMSLLRAYDNKAIALQRTGKMGTYAPIQGQEAISLAAGFCMKPEDVLAPFYRDYGAQLQRGVKMSEIYRYWGGDEFGSAYENCPNDFPMCVPIASQCLHAAGAASAFKLRGEQRVAVTSIGEGGTSEGDFYEAMNVAGAWRLPLVFVINNNQWAISVPREKQTCAQTIAQKAIAAGIDGIQVDGNDIIAMVDTMSKAMDKARSGGGATVIEAITYRLCDHTTADDASRYRPQEQYETALKLEPIKRLRRYLESQSLWDSKKQQTLDAYIEKEVIKTVAEYENYPKTPVTDMFDYHFATLPEALIEQRQAAVENANA